MESNDSPEIPDRGETSDIPGLPSGAENQRSTAKHIKITKRRFEFSLGRCSIYTKTNRRSETEDYTVPL